MGWAVAKRGGGASRYSNGRVGGGVGCSVGGVVAMGRYVVRCDDPPSLENHWSAVARGAGWRQAALGLQLPARALADGLGGGARKERYDDAWHEKVAASSGSTPGTARRWEVCSCEVCRGWKGIEAGRRVGLMLSVDGTSTTT